MSHTMLNRRDFLRTTGAAGAAALLGSSVRADDKPKLLKPTADTLVVLWMAGGQASTET